MNNGLYLKLAVTNIKKNAKNYIPYLLTCICTIMMYYIMSALSKNQGLDRMSGGDQLKILLSLGSYIIALFSIIFLFYTNNFLIKQRKKEFGLFYILGMEKRHLSKMLWWETFMTAVISLGAGIALGILFNKLMFLVLLKILNFQVPMGFFISLEAVRAALILFGILFVCILLNTMRHIYFTKPVELLKGDQIGEREPKTKWLLVCIGILSLGGGYFIAVTTKQPLQALNDFFVAVLLVILGTYCLFTAISIAILKMLRKHKKYYYRTKHFISVSGMIYRMKQNAVGLANICILSTMVLVVVSTTVSLYVGMEDVLHTRYSRDVEITSTNVSKEYNESLRKMVEGTLQEQNLEPQNMLEYRYQSFIGEKQTDGFQIREETKSISDVADISVISLIPLEDYNRVTGESVSLEEEEILVYFEGEDYRQDTFNLFNRKFVVKESLEVFLSSIRQRTSVYGGVWIVVKDMSVADALNEEVLKTAEQMGGMVASYLGFNLKVDDEQVIAVCNEVNRRMDKYPDTHLESPALSKESFYSLYGGLFFLGIFLGIIFMIGAILIIYYKQISEGYEDKGRFDIMQKVGMSRDEIKAIIRGQVLMVFFLPLVTAVFHIIFAFGVITKLLVVLNLSNVSLFAFCTAGTILIFALFYGLVYGVTAREYYKIVK